MTPHHHRIKTNTTTAMSTPCMALLLLLPLLLSVADAFLSVRHPSHASTTKTTTTHNNRAMRTTELPMASSSSSSSYKKVFVAGGTKGVGRAIVEQLSAKGIPVVALVRRDEAKAELEGIISKDNNHMVTAVIGDAFDPKSVETAMDGCDAAITTLGGTNADGRRVDYEGNTNVIESAGILGVQRIVLVTSIGCGSSREAAPPSVFEVLKDVLAAKEKAENILMDFYTNSKWTIIRPGGLVSEPMTGKAILTEDNTAIGGIHREDVARLVLEALDSSKTEQKVLSAIDPSITSSIAAEGKQIAEFALK